MKLKYNLDFISDKAKKSNLKKAISILEGAFYNGKEVSSFFLDPFEQKAIEGIVKANEIEIDFLGCSNESERKIFVCNSLSKEIDTKKYLQVLEFKKSDIKHRDVLGALIHLGLDRENIGDIVVFDDKCEFVVLNRDKNFVIYNLTKIKNEGIKIKEKENNQLDNLKEEFTSHSGFVSSLRLDNIVSEILNTSRNNVKKIINAKDIKVDFLMISDPSKIINEGSMISIRHVGRFYFDEITGLSKKGNYHINYRKFKWYT